MIFFKNSDNDSKLNEINSLILNGNLYFVAQKEVELMEDFNLKYSFIELDEKIRFLPVFNAEDECWNYK
jgi:hypothetical protein